ncbi:MAG TPA: hypothetical protein VEI49_00465 [Terriglobales bacterium]|nr:hypothetical protein [Terriglobales bacterium]
MIQLSTTAAWLVAWVTLARFRHADAVELCYDQFREWYKHLHVSGVSTQTTEGRNSA